MSIRAWLRATLCVAMFTLAPASAEEIRDYYSEPGINPFKETQGQGNEQIDPFGGTLQLSYTDVHVPGNGGMDLNIVRTYTSLQTNFYPILGLNGLGWNMHFGRIVIARNHLQKMCNHGTFPLTTKENPSLELPDGGRELLVLNHLQNDNTLITRTNWRAHCVPGMPGMMVTAPDGTRYTMDRFDNFQLEPSWLTTRIEDVNGNWIAISYATNPSGVSYVTQVSRNEDGVIATFEYEDQSGPGIALSAIHANGQTWSYQYETIPGYMFSFYKQLVRVGRPDGRSWHYRYNPKMGDPDPDDGQLEDGMASYSLIGITHPYGAVTNYTYQYVFFDPASPVDKTTAIHTKSVGGGAVESGTWTYTFHPHSVPYADSLGGTLHYDRTEVTAPEAIYSYVHMGKDVRSDPTWGRVFIRPSFVGLMVSKETYTRGANPRLVERIANSWGSRKISNEDFWHGSGYRDWWRDDGTYAPVLNGEYVSRDSQIDGTHYAHAKTYFDYDMFGNPGRVVQSANIAGQPDYQVTYTYFSNLSKWIIGLPEDELHEAVGSGATTTGRVEREYDQDGHLMRSEEFGEETLFTYTNEGEVHTRRDARGSLTTYRDYKRGIAQREELPEGVVIRREVNDTGTLRAQIDGRGIRTSFTYDDMHRLTYINYPVNDDVSVSYDEGGGLVRRTLTRGRYQQTESFDDFGNKTRTFRRDLVTGQTLYRNSRFDAHGREIFTSYPNSAQGISTTFDGLGRVLRTTHPDNTAVVYDYDDAVVSVTNERGFKTTYTYLVYGLDYAGQDPVLIAEPENVSTHIERDVWSNPTRVFQGERLSGGSIRGYGKDYVYDAKHRLVESTEPETGHIVYTHDELGNVVSERLNNLAPITFTYDRLNRRTLVNFPDATPDVATGYDDNDNITSVTKGATSWIYGYDDNDNLLSETLTVNQLLFSRTYATSHTYSGLDVLESTTYPSGLVVDYAPDGFGRATRVGSFASNVTYHPSGSVASYQLANGVVTNVELNNRLLTQSIVAQGVSSLSYTYDASGNVLGIADGLDASKSVVMQPSSYDGLDRLLNANGRWGSSNFAYDFHGNLRTKAIGARGMSYRFDAQRRARQVDRFDPANPGTLVAQIRYDFDARGNARSKRQYNFAPNSSAIQSIDDRQFDYDSASQLIKASVTRLTPGNTTTLGIKDYLYDGNGQRVVEHRHGSYDVRFSVYSRGGDLVFEDSINECTKTDYLRLGALSIGRSDDKPAAPSLDTDGDTIPDCLETVLGLNPASAADAAADSDGDGLTNLQEFQAGTSLTRVDTDGDGLSDRDEVQRDLTDPTSGDSDGDGLGDGVEAANPALDPRTRDRDHDGVNDALEVRLGTDPGNPADALLDSDGDGFSNRQESQGQADPVLNTQRPERGTQLWSADTFGSITAAAAIGKDRSIHVLSGGRLYAFNPDGTRRWMFQPPIPAVAEPTIGPDGTIYLVSRASGGEQNAPKSFIYAINPNGTERWVRPTTDWLYSPVTVGLNGRLYVGGFRSDFWSSQGVMLVLDAAGSITGARLNTNSFQIAPAVAANGDVYAVDYEGQVVAMTATLGNKWTHVMRGRGTAVPSIASDGTVYVSDEAGYTYSLNAATGARTWEQLTGPTGPQHSSVAIAADGNLYVGSYEGKLIALDRTSGAQRWSVQLTGTAPTPALAANGLIYAATYGGDLMAVNAVGQVQWTASTGAQLRAAPVVDRDGTVYFAAERGQLFAVADDGGGPARSAWPMHRHDSAQTGYLCFNEPAFSITADGDGDGIDDCSELRYGLNPNNAADGALDADGDGLSNAAEHARGTRLDLADTDGDGLSDGVEVNTHLTDPTLADTDHDALNDGFEIANNSNPLNAGDATQDSDGDGFSNRQEALAGTNPFSAASAPTVGRLLREDLVPGQAPKFVAVGRDGTIYQNTGSGLEALNPDFTTRWTWPTAIIGTPAVGPDGTLFVATARNGADTQRLVAILPNGAERWSVSFTATNELGLFDSPVVGTNGYVYLVETTWDPSGDTLRAYDANGARPEGFYSFNIFGRRPKLAVNAAGNVVAYDPVNSLSLFNGQTGSQMWRNTTTARTSGTNIPPVVGPDGTIYIRGVGSLMAFDPANGTRRWVHNNTSPQGYPLVTADNRVILYCGYFINLCAIDSTGAVVWTDTNDYTYTGTPVLGANGSILAMTNNNRLVSLDSAGAIRWETTLANMLTANYPVILADGTVYIGSAAMRQLVIGDERGLPATGWPARDRDYKNSRNLGGVTDIEPSPLPSLMITAPTAASIQVDLGQSLAATAVAADFQDGNLSPQIRWTSSLAGQVGTGPTLALGNLPVGTHVLTAAVTDSSGNTASATRTVEVGVFAPVVDFWEPYADLTYDEGATIRFHARSTDVKDGDLSASIRWTSSRDGLIGTGADFSRSDLSRGTHVITASSTDSNGQTTSQSVTISVAVLPPNVDIYQPYANQEYEFGTELYFFGWAYDGVDGDLSNNLQWSSDLEGPLGTGSGIYVSNLRLGTHVITITVTDSSGGVGTTSRTIVVRHLPPSINVFSPSWNTTIQEGDFVTFSGSASDALDGDLSEQIQWYSSLDGLLGTGSGIGNSELSVGMHLITAQVTDSGGQTATSSARYLTVQSPTNSAPFVWINSPATGTQVYLNDPVTLSGGAFDNPSTQLSSSIQWSSNLDGALGTGASLTTSALRVGTHTLRAFVEDAGGARAAATVQLTVSPIPANYPPTVKFTSFGVGSRYTVNDAFAMSATASDREQGDLTASIVWNSSIAGPLGTGGTVFVSGLPAGVHEITARITDAFGNIVTQSRNVEIFVDGEALLVNDAFSVSTGPNVLAGWQSFDDGSTPASLWRVLSGALNEASNSSTSPTTAAGIEKPGTYIRQTTGDYWLDYRVDAALRATDNDAFGIMFRYIDNNNYYRFSMDSERAYRRLVKKQNGVYTLLWSDAVAFTTNTTYNVAITAVGANLTLAINGTQLYSGSDSAHRRGTVAMYAWNMTGANFDNVKVTNLRTVSSNDPPLITISSPPANASYTVGSPVTLSATALDFEDGAVSGIAWASSRDGALGTGGTLSLSSLTVGTHTLTASAVDSDGVAGSGSVSITINPPFNNPPTIDVTSPANGAVFPVGSTVSLAASAADTEDGTLSNGVTWSSSRDGALGTGAALNVSSLTSGAHVITASITDSGGKTTTATRNITIAVPNNTAPVVTRTAPLPGAAFGVGQSIAFTATATDAEEGNVTSRITWSSSRDGALGNGGTLSLSTLTGGIHTITTTVTDTMGGSHSVTTTINVVPTAATLVRDDFGDGNANGWSVTDEGTTNAPSIWGVTSGSLRQTSNIHTTPVTAANVARPGTFNRWTAGSAWTNYSLTAELRAGDDDVIGVMFRYTNTSNYYRFSIDRERPSRRLQKKRNGTWTTIWSDSTAFNLNQTYVVEVIANGSTLTVKMDGVQLFSGSDSNALTTGTVAMYCWNNTDARFDNILVRDLAVPFSGGPPPLTPLDELWGASPLLAGMPHAATPGAALASGITSGLAAVALGALEPDYPTVNVAMSMKGGGQ